jgi:hypothetical protein
MSFSSGSKWEIPISHWHARHHGDGDDEGHDHLLKKKWLLVKES